MATIIVGFANGLPVAQDLAEFRGQPTDKAAVTPTRVNLQAVFTPVMGGLALLSPADNPVALPPSVAAALIAMGAASAA